MSSRPLVLTITALLAATGLAACRPESAKLSPQDDGIAANDPVVKGALGDSIMVNPDLANQSNNGAATAGVRPVDAGVPSARGGGSVADAATDVAAIAGGALMRTPEPGAFDASCDSNCAARQPRAATLGGLARQQAGGACAADIRYGAEWAQRLPAAFPVYPRAALVEAAGVANGRCNVRVVNFQTRAGMQAVLDFYYTQARRAGYDAEHLLRGNEHYLGGTSGNNAFVVMARVMDGGIVDVDLVASGGN